MTLADLYDEYESILSRYALRLTRDTFRADDLVQETFVRAIGHLPLLNMLKRHQRRAWLYQTLKHLFLDEQKVWQRREEILAEIAKETDGIGPTLELMLGDNPFDLVPDEYREIFEMRYVLGMNSGEIAKELGIPAATVRSRLHLVLKKIRRQSFKLK